MHLLLDESVPRRLRRALLAHTVKTAVEMGWGGVKNGALLTLAAAEFDAFITVDKNLLYQQNITAIPIAVVVLIAYSNELQTLLPLVPRLEEVLATLQPRTLVQIGSVTTRSSGRAGKRLDFRRAFRQRAAQLGLVHMASFVKRHDDFSASSASCTRTNPIGEATGPSVTTVDQADMRALVSRQTVVRHGAALLYALGCRSVCDPKRDREDSPTANAPPRLSS